MNEDRLQERLARLEAGESLAACAEGMPPEETELLNTAARMQSIELPGRDVRRAAEQRANLMRAARHESHETAAPKPARRAALPRPALALGALAVAVLAVFVLRTTSPSVTTIADPPATNPAGAPDQTDQPYTQYVPVVNSSLSAPDPRSAVLTETRGVVEVFSEGRWEPAQVGKVFHAGQRLRTGQLSSATLLFYDRSQTRLGPASDVTLDALDARIDGPRVVQITQAVGETDHEVVASSYRASRYEVRTPAGSGASKGTSFHVSVSASLVTRISVDEGMVAATHQNATVIVAAGQETTIHAGSAPAQPVFRVWGEGIVTQIGQTWRIGGLEFATDEDTVVSGNPQVGDFVRVDGHLRADGTRVADSIVLLRRAVTNRFRFSGIVESMGEAQWTISGRTVVVSATTSIDSGIETGDLV